MIYKKNITTVERNAWFVFGLFWIVVVFQLTALKNIWSIETLGRVVNFSVLLLLSAYVLWSIGFSSFNRKLWIYYILPGALVYAGLFINIGRNVVSNIELMACFGFVIPWAIYLAMPGLMKRKVVNYQLLWRYFYYFMLISVVCGLLEYVVFFKYELLSFKVLETKYGVFLGCWFSLYHMLGDGTPHYRFYGNFIEPGTLAMWLLPVMAYAFLSKKYVGLAVLGVGLFLTNSLGGFIGLFMYTVLMIFVKLNYKKSHKYFAIGLAIISFSIMWFFLSNSFASEYENKAASRTERVDNVFNTFSKLGTLVKTSPFGINLAVSTEDNMKNEMYVGSNFMPVVYYQNGGILAFTGYLLLLFFSLSIAFKLIQDSSHLLLEEKVVFMSIICLFPFIVQRTTIYESAMYALLFSPVIIERLLKKPSEFIV